MFCLYLWHPSSWLAIFRWVAMNHCSGEEPDNPSWGALLDRRCTVLVWRDDILSVHADYGGAVCVLTPTWCGPSVVVAGSLRCLEVLSIDVFCVQLARLVDIEVDLGINEPIRGCEWVWAISVRHCLPLLIRSIVLSIWLKTTNVTPPNQGSSKHYSEW